MLMVLFCQQKINFFPYSFQYRVVQIMENLESLGI